MEPPAPPPTPRDADRAAYLARFRAAAGHGPTPELAALVWARVYRHDGPAVAFARGEEPAGLLAWVLDRLPRPEADAVATAAAGLLADPPAADDRRAVAAAAEVCYLLELGRREGAPDPDTVRGLLAGLTTDAGPTARARALYALETPTGDRLLSVVLRALALHTPPDLAPAWHRLVAAEGFEGAALPAFLGYCRAAGRAARDALPGVARALAALGQPELFSVALKSFATAAYADDGYDPGRPELAAGDVAGLFAAVPAGSREGFAAGTLAAVGRIGFAPPGLPEGLFLALLGNDLGPAAVPVFEALARAAGADARVALPLVARAVYPAAGGAAALAGVLARLRDPADLTPAGRERARAGYVRRPLDAGDFATLFVLVPPAARPGFRAATFAALKGAGAGAGDLRGWGEAADAPLTGLLGDAIDSPLFTKYRPLHLLLAPALRAADRRAFDALRGVYVRSDPVRPVPLDRPWLSRPALAPADRFLYAPAAPELREWRADARAAARRVGLRTVAGGAAEAADLAPDPADINPRRLAALQEEAVLDLTFWDQTLDPARADEVAAELVGTYAQAVMADRRGGPAAAGGPSFSVWRDARPAAAGGAACSVSPPSAERAGRTFRGAPATPAARPGLLAWLRDRVPNLLRFDPVLAAGLSPAPRDGGWGAQLSLAPA